LTEVVYGIGLGAKGVAWCLGVAALPAWWFLLFFGPIYVIWRDSKDANTFGSPGLSALIVVYVLAVGVILIATAEAYSIRGTEASLELRWFPIAVLYQVFQPVTWYGSWKTEIPLWELGIAALIIGVVIGFFAMVTYMVWRFGKWGKAPGHATAATEDGIEAPPTRSVGEPKPPSEESSPNKEPPQS